MKIRISNLLLAIKVFLHFNELNAMYNVEGINDPRSGLLEVAKPEGAPDVSGRFWGKDVELWLNRNGNVENVYFNNCRLPLASYYVNESFLIRYAQVAGHGLVAYVSQSNELLGLVGPNQIKDGNALIPTRTEWYINYWHANKFKLSVFPVTKTVYGIEVFGGNHPGFGKEEAKEFSVPTIAGIEFSTYVARNRTIIGAKLVRNYNYEE